MSSDSNQIKNFYNILKRQFTASNLLGKNETVDQRSTSDDYISYAERKRYNQEAKNVDQLTPIELEKELGWARLTIINLANGRLKGKELGLISSKTEAIKGISNYYRIKNIEPDDKTFLLIMYSIIDCLVYAVALLEGNLPPNDLGYLAQNSHSKVENDEIALESLDDVAKIYSQFSRDSDKIDKLFLNEFSKYFNLISERINSKRPTFMGEPVRDCQVARL